MSNLKHTMYKLMLCQVGQKNVITSKDLTSNHGVPKPCGGDLSKVFFGQGADEAAALEVVHL